MLKFLGMYWKGILLATVAAMVIGSVWYSKAVFGKEWQKLVGLKDSEMGQGAMQAMLVMLVMALVTAVVLKRFLVIAAPASYWEAIKVSLWIWVGFVAAFQIGGGMFEKRPAKLVALNVGNQLLTLVVMTAILFAVN